MAQLHKDGGYDLAELWKREGLPGVILGANVDDAARGSVWNIQAQQGHALTFGATRSGKGVAAIIPALLTYAGSMVCIDPKAENGWATIPRRKVLGNRVVLVDPWGELNRRYGGGEAAEPVTRFNPLAELDPYSPNFGDEVAAVADALITQNSSDPHWPDSAREMVAGLVAAYVEARPGKATLRDVRRALLLSQEDFGKLIEFFEKGTPDGLGARKLAGFKIGSREVDSIRSNAKTQTAFLDSEPLCDSLEGEEDPFRLAELARGRVTLYLVLPLDRLQTHGRWLRLILTLAIRAITQQPRPPAVPVLFMLDEFGTIGKLSMVEQAFGLMAGVGVRLWCFLQDLNQLKRDYPESWETFIANCAIIQILNARDATTSKYFSEYIGDYLRERISVATAKIRDGTSTETSYKGVGPQPDYKSMSDSIEREPVIEPSDLRHLGEDRQIVFFIGSREVVQRRFNYYDFNGYYGKYRPLPGFPVKPWPKPKMQTVDEAIAKIKAAGHTVKSKMMGGWTITDPAGKATSVGSSTADLVAYAEALP